jgi:transposase-like protein
MNEVARREGAKEAPMLQVLGEVIRLELREFVISAGMEALKAVLEEERTAICGPRYEHQGGRRAYRSGHTMGELVLGGRRVQVSRPRARGLEGKEEHLPSWRAFSASDPLEKRALEQMLIGVSSRRYERSLEPVPPHVAARGTSKSAVSRRFVATTKAKTAEWLGRDLSSIDVVVLMIDGVHIDDHVLLIALGIDAEGEKHVLGCFEGATENATACTALLTDLRERGLRTDRTTLAVLDGAKALHKAVREVFGPLALVQRCQVHKIRNVLDQLPEAMRVSVRAAMREAYACADAVRAKKLLQNLARRLREAQPGAAASLEEGLDETLTVMRLGLPKSLARVLSTTNAIENLIGAVRRLGKRVRRWRNGKMILRWTVAAISDAATRFRRIAGARAAMSKLVVALRSRDPHSSQLETHTEAA